jgi:acyl-CoA hydrolase
MHVDVLVGDLVAAEAEVLRLGATSLDAGTETFRVYTDPSGHPFCLVLT